MTTKQQYRILIEYYGEAKPRCDNPLWQLTEGTYESTEAVREAYKAQAKAFSYKILKVKTDGRTENDN